MKNGIIINSINNMQSNISYWISFGYLKNNN